MLSPKIYLIRPNEYTPGEVYHGIQFNNTWNIAYREDKPMY